jgi:hypothetical protein
MTSFLKDLDWKRTSRNTEIATAKISPYGEVFFKRGLLINALELDKHISSFNHLNEITNRIDNATSPAIIAELCVGDVIALELVSEKSFHELWLEKTYSEDKILEDIITLYSWLEKFHSATIDNSDHLPICYADFGPKNLIQLSDNRVSFIDPPMKVEQKEAYYDFGTLVFEIERSLIQSSRLRLVFVNRKLVQDWISIGQTMHPYDLYIKGIHKHVLNVVLRYANFFKKPRPVIEFFRGFFIIPCLLVYHFLMVNYDLILKYRMKLCRKK